MKSLEICPSCSKKKYSSYADWCPPCGYRSTGKYVEEATIVKKRSKKPEPVVLKEVQMSSDDYFNS